MNFPDYNEFSAYSDFLAMLTLAGIIVYENKKIKKSLELT